MKFEPKKGNIVSNIEVIFPADINHRGTLFGGRLMAWMDKTAYYAAFRFTGCPAVTASVESLDFKVSPAVGDIMDLEAKVIYTGSTSMVIEVSVYRTDVQKGSDRELANTGYFSFVALGNDGKPCPIPSLLVETIEEEKLYLKGKRIKEFAMMRKKIND